MRSVRISLKTARALRDILDDNGGDVVGLKRELDTAMKPKRSVKLAERRRTAKRLTKRGETARIRDAVMARARQVCEACGQRIGSWPLELDHFFGRARLRQTERNCWALCWDCHRAKTLNRPDAAHWFNTFLQHCGRHNFAAEGRLALSRIEALELSKQSAEVGR